ncbi:hypothetical protein Anapl_02943 [Anas platyrhynchos]|uniref:Uncharacterized protein n=1 Tax=Anas platyrhynchos TaxID=8839 RepID=R0JN51_ANAPL|nr:hypothetical protein Anapl_02943 [Anas platyrhynchos]
MGYYWNSRVLTTLELLKVLLDETHTEGCALYLPVTSALFNNGLPGRSQNLCPSVYTITALRYLTVSTDARFNNYEKLESQHQGLESRCRIHCLLPPASIRGCPEHPQASQFQKGTMPALLKYNISEQTNKPTALTLTVRTSFLNARAGHEARSRFTAAKVPHNIYIITKDTGLLQTHCQLAATHSISSQDEYCSSGYRVLLIVPKSSMLSGLRDVARITRQLPKPPPNGSIRASAHAKIRKRATAPWLLSLAGDKSLALSAAKGWHFDFRLPVPNISVLPWYQLSSLAAGAPSPPCSTCRLCPSAAVAGGSLAPKQQKQKKAKQGSVLPEVVETLRRQDNKAQPPQIKTPAWQGQQVNSAWKQTL